MLVRRNARKELQSDIVVRNDSKAPGDDEITNTAIKKFLISAIDILVLILHYMLDQRTFPNISSYAPQAPKGFRPISFLSNLSNIAVSDSWRRFARCWSVVFDRGGG